MGQERESLDVVGVFVGDEDRLDRLRIDADLCKPLKDGGGADARIDEDARRLTADIKAISPRTRCERAKSKHEDGFYLELVFLASEEK